LPKRGRFNIECKKEERDRAPAESREENVDPKRESKRAIVRKVFPCEAYREITILLKGKIAFLQRKKKKEARKRSRTWQQKYADSELPYRKEGSDRGREPLRKRTSAKNDHATHSEATAATVREGRSAARKKRGGFQDRSSKSFRPRRERSLSMLGKGNDQPTTEEKRKLVMPLNSLWRRRKGTITLTDRKKGSSCLLGREMRAARGGERVKRVN